MLPEDGEKNGYWFWKNGLDFRKAGTIQKVGIFVFNNGKRPTLLILIGVYFGYWS
jgi:hypothetical protein